MKEILASAKNIQNKIYEIRGKQVMLDSDLATLYGCKNGTKEINQAVKNNLEKFPERYSWILTDEDWKSLRSKILTLENETGRGKYRKYSPRVFTEQGVAMLATILHTSVATQVSISIMDAFVNMRHYLDDNRDIYQTLNYINTKLIEYDEKFNELFYRFNRKELLFFHGDVYTAYSHVYKLFQDSKQELIIVDPYADLKLLDMISDITSKIKLITSKKTKLTKGQIDLFNEQYNKLVVFQDNNFHDRYFIIDRKEIYHMGTSINSIGKKIFSIVKLEDDFVKDEFMKYIKNVIDNK